MCVGFASHLVSAKGNVYSRMLCYQPRIKGAVITARGKDFLLLVESNLGYLCAAVQGHENVVQLRAEYYDSLISSGREEKAAEVHCDMLSGRRIFLIGMGICMFISCVYNFP